LTTVTGAGGDADSGKRKTLLTKVHGTVGVNVIRQRTLLSLAISRVLQLVECIKSSVPVVGKRVRHGRKEEAGCQEGNRGAKSGNFAMNRKHNANKSTISFLKLGEQETMAKVTGTCITNPSVDSQECNIGLILFFTVQTIDLFTYCKTVNKIPVSRYWQ